LSGIQIPENKVYATISIEPESAGKHLKHFEVSKLLNRNCRYSHAWFISVNN